MPLIKKNRILFVNRLKYLELFGTFAKKYIFMENSFSCINRIWRVYVVNGRKLKLKTQSLFCNSLKLQDLE